MKAFVIRFLTVAVTSVVVLASFAVQESRADDELTGVSPLYTTYNTYINASNFLELLSVGSAQVNAKVSFFAIDGTFIKAKRYYIDPLQQFDIDVNSELGRANTYGVIKIEYNSTNVNARLQGRMSVYRVEDSGTDFSFAYGMRLTSALTGTSFVTSNTYDPQGRGYIVPNWVSITNLSTSTETYTYNVYDQSGSLLSTEMLTLAPYERRDVSGSVGSGEAVFLNEIVPSNASAEYLAGVIRYASNTPPGQAFKSYLYAMPIAASAGTDDLQYVPISNRSDTCWMQTNWVEVLNVSASSATVTVSYRRKDGTSLGSVTQTLAPRSQYHFNASSLLATYSQESGIATVATDVADSVITQSVVYYHDCDDNNLQTAYNIAGRTASTKPLSGSFNRFIDIENELVVFGAYGATRTVSVELRESGSTIHNSTFSLPTFGTEILFLNEPQYSTMPDTYGLIVLDATQPYPFMAYNLRVRKTGTMNDTVDFVMPVPIR